MRLIVFGASGRCGRYLMKQAVERQHQVTGISRRRIDCPSSVSLMIGDVLDRAFVESVISGHDVVVSSLGIRYAHPWARRESPDDFISRATGHIVASMHAAGVRRIAVISAAGVGDSRAAANLVMHCLIATSNVGVAYADLERVEQRLAISGLDWQAVRPTTLSSRRGNGQPRLTRSFPMWASISREDVAAFMLSEIERPAFSSRTPMISS